MMIYDDDYWCWWCSTACTLGWVAISWARFCGPCETLCWIGWAWPRDIKNGITCFSCFSFQDKMWGGNKGTSGWMLKLALTGLCTLPLLLGEEISIFTTVDNIFGCSAKSSWLSSFTHNSFIQELLQRNLLYSYRDLMVKIALHRNSHHSFVKEWWCTHRVAK